MVASMQKHCEKKLGRIYSVPGGKNIIMYIDQCNEWNFSKKSNMKITKRSAAI